MNIEDMLKKIIASGLSQNEVAKCVGCHQSTISRLQTGRHALHMNIEVYKNILVLYGGINNDPKNLK